MHACEKGLAAGAAGRAVADALIREPVCFLAVGAVQLHDGLLSGKLQARDLRLAGQKNSIDETIEKIIGYALNGCATRIFKCIACLR